MDSVSARASHSWPIFAAWALVGALWTMSFVAQPGLALLLLAVPVTWRLLTYGRAGSHLLGVAAGVAAVLLLIPFFGSRTCRPFGIVDDGTGELLSSPCHEFEPIVVIGPAVAAAAILLFLVVKR